MIKKLVFGIFLGYGLTLGGQGAVAAEKDTLKVEIDSNPTNILLDWNDVGSYYKVFEKGNLIWQGQKSRFLHENLASADQYNYVLKSYDDKGNEIDSTIIRTNTKRNTPKINKLSTNSFSTSKELNEKVENTNQINDLLVSSTVNDEEVIVSWEGNLPDEDGTYEVYKDGEKIGETQTNLFVDTDIKTGEKYLYEIIGNTKINDERISEIKKTLKDKDIEITKEDEKELFYDTFIISRLVKTSGTKISLLAAAVDADYVLRYTTFIPMKYAENPFGIIPGVETSYFNGNNRGFDPFATSFKTRMDVKIGFHGGKGSVSLPTANKQVQATKLYDQDYKSIGTPKTASYTGMNIRDMVTSSSKVSWNAYHDIGLPYMNTVSPDITYSYNASVWSDGGYNISGSHDKAPSHEIYIMVPFSDMYNTIHQKAHVGFKYLWPVAANYTISASY